MTQLLTLLLFFIIHKTINVWNFYMILSCRFKETFNNLRSRSLILPKYASNYCQNAVVRLTSTYFRSIHPGVQPHLLKKDVLKICSKFTGEHPCRSAILIFNIESTGLNWKLNRKVKKFLIWTGIIIYTMYITIFLQQ